MRAKGPGQLCEEKDYRPPGENNPNLPPAPYGEQRAGMRGGVHPAHEHCNLDYRCTSPCTTLTPKPKCRGKGVENCHMLWINALTETGTGSLTGPRPARYPVASARLALPEPVSENAQKRQLGFRELHTPEAQFPRRPPPEAV